MEINQANAKLNQGCTLSKMIPQGSVIGSKLLNIYVNDLPIIPKSKTEHFTDNTAIYIHVTILIKQIQVLPPSLPNTVYDKRIKLYKILQK